ncbi:MAG TPA: RecX family transcriptional regulator [Gemmatimonadales bacterium]|jgi:regulatory protein|nr:RecX family transcriptional regulator [Gemmatimonadales bacterium]
MTATPSELSGRVIGALATDPRRPGAVRVMVQGRPLLTISREIAVAERLEAGTPLEEPLYARLCRAADEEAAYRTALRLLERRPFAARDLARRLVLKGHPPEAAAAAVEQAHHAGLLDDVRFTTHYVETRAARGRGPLRLRRDLAALGVERAVVDRALTAAFPEDPETLGRLVEPLARKRLAQLRGVPRSAARRRLLNFLARRGFQGAPVQQLVLRLLGGS